MKTTNEILATWETEGFHTDWYAIDSYDPITHEETRLFVGEIDDVVTVMTNYHTMPAMISDAKFYRSSIISSDEALEYFRGPVEPETTTDELIEKCVKFVARKYALYVSFFEEGNEDMKNEYFTAYSHTLSMAAEITGMSFAEIYTLVMKEAAKC